MRVSGGGSAQFLTKGGDNSIAEYGEEAGEAELTEAAEAVYGYSVAFSHDDWVTACSHLSKSRRESFEELGMDSGGQRMSCEEAYRRFFANRSSEVRREMTKVDAVSLRREGDQAFLLYHGSEYDMDNTYGPSDLYSMTLYWEEGVWKLGLPVGYEVGYPKNLPESLKR